MTHEQLWNLSPCAQEQCLCILLEILPPAVREAAMEVFQWLATEYPSSEQVTSNQILQWIEDVQARDAQRNKPASVHILQLRRTP
ncbi:hypothetical protein [Massilia sp. CCM 8734]|uniref:hypothetical protein n=1 Tax=Massilia sp. CCM 8734 TaxID=2609283 RepID=UPI0014205432|nr:hypothetical protein [Massilia sp. CCM 8734]NHZ99044.1 hypothetical protein [Massilia sp. CCM 8734]